LIEKISENMCFPEKFQWIDENSNWPKNRCQVVGSV
jgi:hypothetical protein